MTEKENIFWLDKWEGDASGGYFCRCDLFQFFEKCKANGLRVVGIKEPKDWNMEFILEKIKEKDG